MSTNEPRIYSADEVAAELGITPQRVRALAQSRGVGTKVGGYMWAFTASDVDAMRERKPGRPAKESEMSSEKTMHMDPKLTREIIAAVQQAGPGGECEMSFLLEEITGWSEAEISDTIDCLVMVGSLRCAPSTFEEGTVVVWIDHQSPLCYEV